MLPKTHAILGFLIGLLIFILFPQMGFIGFILIILSSVLIDVDHYIYYVIKKNDLSLKNAYKWFIEKSMHWDKMSKLERQNYKRAIMLFHGIEFWLVLALLAFINVKFLYILIGIMIHIMLDFIHMFYHSEPLYVKMSQIHVHLTNKNKKEFL